jgi:cytochrome c biogenesis protein
VRNKAGVAKFDQVVDCVPQDLTNYLSSCVVKVDDTGAQVPSSYTDPKTGKVFTTNADGTPYTKPLYLSALINFAPTAAFNASLGLTSIYPAPNLPRAVIGAFTGDYGADSGAAQSIFNLDTQNLTPIAIPAADSVITPGPNSSVPLTDGFTLSVTSVSQYATLQVKDDPAKLVVLVAAGLIVLGLLGSLRVRRRRLWLRATPGAEGRTLIEVGGLARTDADDFAREFRGLVGRLAEAIPPAGSASADPARPAHAADSARSDDVAHSAEDPNAR